jgi:hypothetical protein
MPVILPPGNEREWPHPGAVTLFQPFLSELITAYPVTAKINNANFNEPAAIAPSNPQYNEGMKDRAKDFILCATAFILKFAGRQSLQDALRR